MEVENLIDVLDFLACWLFGNIVSTFAKLPVYDSVYCRATLPKNIRIGTETMKESANKLNLAWCQMAMIMRHVNVEVLGSFDTLCIVIECSFMLLPSA